MKVNKATYFCKFELIPSHPVKLNDEDDSSLFNLMDERAKTTLETAGLTEVEACQGMIRKIVTSQVIPAGKSENFVYIITNVGESESTMFNLIIDTDLQTDEVIRLLDYAFKNIDKLKKDC